MNISADIKYFLSRDDIQKKSVEELNEILKNEFSFDNWEWQKQNNVKITEPFRADYLNRVLYKCSKCGKEGEMYARGIELKCTRCGAKWDLTEDGSLLEKSIGHSTPYGSKDNLATVPAWFQWEREQVRKEITEGKYHLKTEVEIYMMVNTKAIYHVGQGILEHSSAGFVLDGCNGKLHYEQSPKASYSLYSDYYWYEIGDMICIGDMKTLYYCFPKESGDIVAKARIATEELYKLNV